MLSISLIKSCTHKTHLLQIHAHILSASLLANATVCFEFLTRSLSRDLRYSRKFFAQIERPNSVLYNAMIRAYSTTDSALQGFELYRDMRRRSLEVNVYSLMLVVKCCARVSPLTCGKQVHARAVRDGHGFNLSLVTSLMAMYSICDKFGDARKLFDETPHRDSVSWNVLVSCCLRNKRTRDALTLFDAMMQSQTGSQPDEVTCLLLLKACASLNAMEFGERIHRYVEEHGYTRYTNLQNALVSMYSRCGSMEKAYNVFKRIPEKNVVSWSAMISGLAMNGRGREAIDAFEVMKSMGVNPTEHTFTGVLSGCSHSGLVNEGKSFFNRMKNEFGIAPNVRHYGCMVDLLGRAGQLDEAYHVVLTMEVKPDPKIWRTLLGSCRIHGRVDLGERVFDHLIELKAQEAGDYVLLLNVYSSAGKWEKVTEIRKLLKDRAIQTTPGCSTIELKGVVHEFIADDVNHRRKDEIYEKLTEINSQLKIAGYVVEVSSESHNVGPKEKEFVLSCHSEKLAIAFGLLSTRPGATIRVSKNLRTCVDCHNFAKILSGVYDREVVVRDRVRFHHFRDGRCSCNDYW